jgi:hypothetical protein
MLRPPAMMAAAGHSTHALATLDEITKEKQRIGEALARVDS